MPALVALALITAAVTPAFAQLKPRMHLPTAPVNSTCGGSFSAAFNTPADTTRPGYLVGDTVNITVTVGRTGASTTTETSTFSTFNLDLACSSFDAPCTTLDTTGPDAWEGVTGTTCKDSGGVNNVSWSLSGGGPVGGTGQPVVLTASSPVTLVGNSTCDITFSVNILKAASDGGSDQIAHEGQSSIACSSGGAGFAGGSYAIPVDSCGLTLVKQVSCDYAYWNDPLRGNMPANATWHNEGGCTGFEGDVIAIRYVLSNPGTVTENETNCSITSDVGPVPGGTNPVDTLTGVNASLNGKTIAPGASITSDPTTEDASGTANSLTCDSSHTANEPNLATASCTCANTTAPVTETAHDQATFSCESCDATIDKQVACEGKTYDVACTDPPTNSTPAGCDPVTTTGSNDGEGTTVQDGTNCKALDGHCSDGTTPTNFATCTGVGGAVPCTCGGSANFLAGEDVTVTYIVTQTGQDELDSCTATETNGIIVGGSAITTGITGAPPTIGSGASPQTLGPFTPECSKPLNTAEGSGDTAELKCTCKALPGNTGVKTIDKTDTADFACVQPQLQVVKTCADQSSGSNLVTVTATNGGTPELFNCTVTDSYTTTTGVDIMCPTNGNTTTPFTGLAPVDTTNCTGSVCNIPGGGTSSQEWSGNITALSNDACNTASVTCNIGSSTGPTITASDSHTCVVPKTQTCESVTPGFFMNHPDSVDEAILTDRGGSIQSCGMFLSNAEPNQNCSVIDDLRIIGTNAHNAGIDPADAQLVFQCVTAELNLAATSIDHGSCGDTIPGSQLTFDTCCGLHGVCATGQTDPITGATVAQCQAAVASFNTDRPLFNPTILQGSANSSDQRAAIDINGLGATSSQCGGSRTYVQKKH